MRLSVRVLLCAALFATVSSAVAQQSAAALPAPPPSAPPGAIAAHPEWPAAAPADVKSVDSLLAALYDVISGPAGTARDWERFRSLFVPAGGRLVVTRVPRPDAPAGTKTDVVFLSVDDYVARFRAGAAKDGFLERSIANRIDSFGEMTHVWSTYESRHSAGDAGPFARGINSIELLHSGGRYFIVQIYWDAERPGNPIPAKYLEAR